jgi:hypothetical protein
VTRKLEASKPPHVSVPLKNGIIFTLVGFGCYALVFSPEGWAEWAAILGLSLAAGGGTWLLSAAIYRGWLRGRAWKAVGLFLLVGFGQLLSLAIDSRAGFDTWKALVFIVGFVYVVVVMTRFWRLWFFWRSVAHENPVAIVVDTVSALLILTIMFAGVTAVLVAKGLIKPQPRMETWLFLRSEEHFAWEFLNAVPGLAITKSLNWSPEPYKMKDYWAGALLLSYKLLVILPVIAAFTRLWKRDSRMGGGEAARPEPET